MKFKPSYIKQPPNGDENQVLPLPSKEVEFTHPVSEKKIVIKAKTPLTGLWSASLSY